MKKLWLLLPLCGGLAIAHGDPTERYIVDAGVKLQVEPNYPKQALEAGTEGEVTLEFTIDIFGRVVNPVVIQSSPGGVFDAEVLATINHWRFEPAREPHECRWLEQKATQTFRFRASAAEAERVQVLPTVVEGIPSPERPIVRVRTESELREALARAYPTYDPPKLDLKPLYRLEPDWPRKALVSGTSGFVSAKIHISPDGVVTAVEVKQSYPAKLFDASALRALKRWRFTPPMKDGKPTDITACQHIKYTFVH